MSRATAASIVETVSEAQIHQADDADGRMGVVGTIVASAIAALVGVFVGAVTTFVHRQWPLPLGDVAFPLGIVVGLAIVTCSLAGFRIVFDSRIVAGASAAGILAACALLALPGAGGSVLVVDDPIGYTWAFGPTIIALVVLGWPRIRPLATT